MNDEPNPGRGRNDLPIGSGRDPAHLADAIRLRALHMIAPQGFGYLGQALSSAEMVAGLYVSAYRPEIDDVVCSPGHYIVAFYAAEAEVGRLEPELLRTYGQNDSDLEAIGTERSPGVDLTGGSLGMGLSGAIGFAMANRLKGEPGYTFAFLSDGELQEGQVWEAAMFAAHNRLNRLVVLLDANNSQVDGPVDTITTLDPIADKWRAFGWAAHDIDGHDVAAVEAAMRASLESDRPTIIIGRTSTRTGLACLPDDADGHFIKLPPELARAAAEELESRLA